MSQTNWSKIGTLISGIGTFSTILIGLFVIYDVRRLDRRRQKVQRPGVSYFIIPSTIHHICDFAAQNELEHRVKTITLPSNSESIVDVFIEPTISMNTTEVYFGCSGELRDKPYAIEYFNKFIETGNRRNVIPGKRDGNNDYIDKHHFYHSVEDRQWSSGTGRALGFKIITRRAAKYSVEIHFTGDIAAGKIQDLTIIVEDEPRSRMHCVDELHMSKDCAVGIVPRAG